MEVVYQAERDAVEVMRRTREKVHSICQGHLYRHVKIETIDNEVFEGQIVNMDHRHIYLQPATNAANQAPMQMNAANQMNAFHPLHAANQMNAPYQAPAHVNAANQAAAQMNAANQAAAQMMRMPYPGPFFPVYNPYASTILPLVLFNLLTISLL